MLYEYTCSNCKGEFEFKQKITDKPRKRCPKCRKHKLVRLISKTSFVLKGRGWFKDGYG